MDRKQQRFCLEVMRTGNATEAYRRAGYSPRNDATAAACASKLLRKDKVQERINQLRQQMDRGLVMDALERREVLTRIARDSNNQNLEILKAIDLLNRMDCLYTVKQELMGANGDPVCFTLRWRDRDESENAPHN